MFLDFLFGKKEPQHPPRPAPSVAPAPLVINRPSASGTHIAHHADLVPNLEADHQKLLHIFGAIQAALQARDLATVVRRLDDFRTAIQGHLLTENVLLYVYLEHALAQDAVSHTLIHEFRLEMDAIGKAVLAFLAKYRQLESQPELVAEFGPDLASVGKVLTERIQREESMLYPLYLPHY